MAIRRTNNFMVTSLNSVSSFSFLFSLVSLLFVYPALCCPCAAWTRPLVVCNPTEKSPTAIPFSGPCPPPCLSPCPHPCPYIVIKLMEKYPTAIPFSGSCPSLFYYQSPCPPCHLFSSFSFSCCQINRKVSFPISHIWACPLLVVLISILVFYHTSLAGYNFYLLLFFWFLYHCIAQKPFLYRTFSSHYTLLHYTDPSPLFCT